MVEEQVYKMESRDSQERLVMFKVDMTIAELVYVVRRAGGGRGERREPGAESRGQKNKKPVTKMAGYIGRSL